eukprot:COSAG02_NODE_19969_length_855_cov_0.988095_1_plen_64_part_00
MSCTAKNNGEMTGAHDDATDCVVSFLGGSEWATLLQRVRQRGRQWGGDKDRKVLVIERRVQRS